MKTLFIRQSEGETDIVYQERLDKEQKELFEKSFVIVQTQFMAIGTRICAILVTATKFEMSQIQRGNGF